MLESICKTVEFLCGVNDQLHVSFFMAEWTVVVKRTLLWGGFFPVLKIVQELLHFWKFRWIDQLAFFNNFFGQGRYVGVRIQAFQSNPKPQINQECKISATQN